MRYLVIIIYLFLFTNERSFSETSCINIKFQNQISEFVKLGYYYGNEMLLIDSLKTNEKREAKFEINESNKGLYFLAINSELVFDFMINECMSLDIQFKNSTNLWDVSIDGCEISEAFLNYLHLAEFYKNEEKKLIAGKSNTNIKDSIDHYNDLLRILKNDMNEKIAIIRNSFSGTLLDSYIQSNIPVEIPELIVKDDGSFSWYEQIKYYQQHYFDNVKFSDQRLIYTPILTEMISHYLLHVIKQTPDDVKNGIEIILELSKKNNKVYQFVLDQIFSIYVNRRNDSPEDELIYVDFTNEIYLNEKIDIDSNMETLLRIEIKKKTPVLLLKKFPNQNMYMQNGNIFSLNTIDAEYTIVIYNDPGSDICN